MQFSDYGLKRFRIKLSIMGDVVKPDFSGRWILNRRASILNSGAAAVESGFISIDHREPTFRYRLGFISNGKPVEYAYEGLSDGKEVGEEGSVNILCWDGDVLVFSRRTQSSDALWTISFCYELLEQGRRLRAVEQIRNGGRDQNNIWMFEAVSSIECDR